MWVEQKLSKELPDEFEAIVAQVAQAEQAVEKHHKANLIIDIRHQVNETLKMRVDLVPALHRPWAIVQLTLNPLLKLPEPCSEPHGQNHDKMKGFGPVQGSHHIVKLH